MKKVYTHPNYKYPSLYDDIAVVELGRRIVYDYEQEILFFFFLEQYRTHPQFGDTPYCLDQGEKTYIDSIATVKGYGITEYGERAEGLLTTNVTVINSQECQSQFEANITASINQVI